jgi:YD repeat-containing protein
LFAQSEPGNIELKNLSIITGTPVMPKNGEEHILIEGEFSVSYTQHFEERTMQRTEPIFGGPYHVYDNQRRIIREYPKELKGYVTVYYYNGKKLESASVYSAGLDVDKSYAFLLDTTWIKPKNLRYKIKYTYNTKGQITEAARISEAGSIEKMNYSYDALGRLKSKTDAKKKQTTYYDYYNDNNVKLIYTTDTTVGKTRIPSRTILPSYVWNSLKWGWGEKYVFEKERIAKKCSVERSSYYVLRTLGEKSERMLLTSPEALALIQVGQGFASIETGLESSIKYVANPNPRWEEGECTSYKYELNSYGNWTTCFVLGNNGDIRSGKHYSRLYLSIVDINKAVQEKLFKEFAEKEERLAEEQRKQEERLAQQRKAAEEKAKREEALAEARAIKDAEDEYSMLHSIVLTNFKEIVRFYEKKIDKDIIYDAYRSAMKYLAIGDNIGATDTRAYRFVGRKYAYDSLWDVDYTSVGVYTVIENSKPTREALNRMITIQQNMAILYEAKTKDVAKALKEMNRNDGAGMVKFLTKDALELIKKK